MVVIAEILAGTHLRRREHQEPPVDTKRSTPPTRNP
jgi:hypothetical protein